MKISVAVDKAVANMHNWHLESVVQLQTMKQIVEWCILNVGLVLLYVADKDAVKWLMKSDSVNSTQQIDHTVNNK